MESSLRTRLNAFAIAAALAIGAVGALAIWATQRAEDSMAEVQAGRVKALVDLDSVARTLGDQRTAVLATLAATNDVMVQSLEAQLSRDAVQVPKVLAQLAAKGSDAREATAVNALRQALEKSRSDGLAAVLDKLRKGQFAEADIASQMRYRPQMDAVSKLLDAAIRLEVQIADERYRDVADAVRIQVVATLLATVLALLACVLATGAISRSLQRVLGAQEKDLAQSARHVAEGRLTHAIEVRPGDSQSVAASLNAMSRQFSRLVADVATCAQMVAAASGRMADANDDLSERTSSQASSLEQTAASMEELSTAVKHNTENAARARKLAEEARDVATEGGSIVTKTADTMAEVRGASRKIGEIAGVIDALAFQTNLLALNAAVEAARAGDQGRGFAVVAAEVRALAQRSAESARDIRLLIDASVKSAEAGARQVGALVETMNRIVDSTSRVSAIVADIARASGEQMSGIAQVNGAVVQLDGMTQSNVALVERAADDAAQLKAQAAELVASVSRFEIEPEAAPPSAPPPPADALVPRHERELLRLVKRAA
jgi:methyl-accepting chemotaxis protein-1 (serine sensor receptor)